MLYELIIVILLSIITTALMLSLAKFLQKIWKINHPKNVFWIYLIVLLTALSVIPLSSIAFSTPERMQDDSSLQLIETEAITVTKSTFITNIQNTTYSSTIRPIQSTTSNILHTGEISRYLQQISWNEYIYSDEPICPDGITNIQSPLKAEKSVETAFLPTQTLTCSIYPYS